MSEEQISVIRRWDELKETAFLVGLKVEYEELKLSETEDKLESVFKVYKDDELLITSFSLEFVEGCVYGIYRLSKIGCL